MDQLLRPRAARAVPVTFDVELGRNGLDGEAFGLRRFPAQLLHPRDNRLLGREMAVRFHTFHAFPTRTLALMRAPAHAEHGFRLKLNGDSGGS